MRRFEIYLDSAWHDISHLYVPQTYTFENTAFNSGKKSTVTSASFSLYWNQELHDAILAEQEEIRVRVTRDLDVEFLGQMDPVLDVTWNGGLAPQRISIECVDFSVSLDEKTIQSASYPAVVGGTPYWIYNSENLSQSILFRTLETAGLAGMIDPDAPSIDQQVRHVAWVEGESTYREIIDSLLADYGWCLVVRGERLTWIQTAVSEMGNVDDITPRDITGQVQKNLDYITEDGVSVIWPKTKVMTDALLWRGDLPIGDTSNPRPGEPIASGDYWPEDSDIIETWQDFGVEYLDVDWLEGRTRLRNDELKLISSSDWVLTDSKDEEVVIDPVEESTDIVYEALRARLRYKNTALEARRLYYSQINGTALVKTHKITTTIPEECGNADEYSATYIYDQTAAERLARIRWMWMQDGRMTFTFSSMREFVPGEYYHLHQGNLYDGYIQIQSAYVTDSLQTIRYTATSTAPFREEKSVSIGSQGSGAASPGQDGASWRNAYTRAWVKPERPTGSEPTGWTLDDVPLGEGPLWMSSAKFDSTGKMLTGWTDPVRVSGEQANTVRFIYIRSFSKPATPVGDSPAGWTFDSIPDGYQPIWQSIGQFGETGNLVGAWTEPVRVSGETQGAYRGALDSLPAEAMDGDWFLYTGASTGSLTQYHVYKYVAIDDEWIETTESDKIMALQKDALQIAKDTGEVIYAAMLFVDLLVARKLMVGGGDEYSGLLCRFLDDDGTGTPVIEIRNNGQRLFWLDVDTGKLYANFSRVVQFMPYTFNDSLDSTHPAVFDLYIPEGEVRSMRVMVRSQKFRTYSKATVLRGMVDSALNKTSLLGGNGITYTLAEDSPANVNTGYSGGHTHSYSAPQSNTNLESAPLSGNLSVSSSGDHTHTFNTSTGYASQAGNHSHTISGNLSVSSHSHGISTTTSNTGSGGSHVHSVFVPKYKLDSSGSFQHAHSVNISHEHDIKLGIIEDANASGMTFSFDNSGEGSFSTQVSVSSGQEITGSSYSAIARDNVTAGGWKQIRVTSTTLGRVQVQVILEMAVDTTQDA